MALKPDRDYSEVTDVMNFWISDGTQNTAVKGGIASVVSSSSGVAMDASGNVVSYAAVASGAIPKGILLQPVNPALSSTRDFPNLQNGEVRPGDKVTLVRKGWLVTDQIVAGETPAVGDAANVGASGLISSGTGTDVAQIGRFETTVDNDGFARIYIDI